MSAALTLDEAGDLTPGTICTCRQADAGSHRDYVEWFATNVLPVDPTAKHPQPCGLHEEDGRMTVTLERPTVADHAGTVAAFLDYVHEHAIAAGLPGRVVVSERQPPGSMSRYLSKSYDLDQLDAAAAGCVRISSKGLNAYVRVHLLDRHLVKRTERGKKTDSRWVTHYAADVDYGTAGHTSNELPPDEAAALALIDATLAPSAVVSSGGGLYPIWRLPAPFEVTTDEDRQRVRNLGKRIDRALAAHGYHVDPTCLDLSRIIRPPGVTNHKPGRDPRPVTVLRRFTDGAGDYTLDQLERVLPALPQRAPVTPSGPKTTTSYTTTTPAAWDILAERYSDDDILAADPLDRWERVDDVHDGDGHKVPAWRRVGSTGSDYSIKAGSRGAFVVWSSTLAARLGIDPGDGISRWQLLCHFAGVDPKAAARWSA
jgi:hypothetical protein